MAEDLNKRIDDIIHNRLIPLQQIFREYEQLSHNRMFNFDRKVFRRCVLGIQGVIEELREMGGGEKDDRVDI